MKIQGGVTINLVAEERAFWINAMKDLKTKNDLEERIVKRTIARLLRKNVYKFPLYPDKECPHCERTFAHRAFERHEPFCRRKHRAPSFKVDPEILERIKHER